MRDFLEIRKRLTVVSALVGCTLVAALSLAARQDDEEPKNEFVLQLTARFTGQYRAQESMKDVRYVSENETNDQVVVTLTGTEKWKINRNIEPPWRHKVDEEPLELLSSNFTVTVTGGGKSITRRTVRVNCPEEKELVTTTIIAWTYQGGGGPAEGPNFGLSLKYGLFDIAGSAFSPPFYRTGGQLTSSGTMEVIEQTCAGTEKKWSTPHRGVGIGTNAQFADPQNPQDLYKKLRRTFKPNPKQLRFSGIASTSYTLPAATSNTDPRRFTSSTTGTLEVSYTFSYGGEPQELEAEMWVEKDWNYDEWLPEGDVQGEQVSGNLLQVKVKLQVKDKPNEEVREKARFRFELDDVSTEPGVCMNWPESEKVRGTPDMAFEEIVNDTAYPPVKVQSTWTTQGGRGAGPKAHTKGKDTRAEIYISSFDYGGWGTLKVYADLESGKTLVAHLKGKPSIKELRIPKDQNKNHIADKWENDMGVKDKDASSDDDNYPRGDGKKGDGLSIYQEYRGFMAYGGHIRTDPQRKDVFIHSESSNFSQGIELFRLASGLEVHEIEEKEYVSNDTRIINMNAKAHNSGVTQHGLWLKASRLDDKIGGQSPIGPPKYVDKVEINEKMPEVSDIVAHELGHAVGMPHHGNKNERRRLGPSGSNKRYYVAVRGGQNSGGEPCIMRYRWADYVKVSENGRGKFLPYYGTGDKLEERGTRFCQDDEGTGVNGPNGWTLPDGRKIPKTGNATGGCGDSLRHIRVSDRYETPAGDLEAKGCL